MYLGPLGQGIDGEFRLVVPKGSEVVLSDGVHDANVALESLGLEELREQLPHLFGLFFGVALKRGGEHLVDAVGPPRCNKLVLVREQELVAGGPTEYYRRFPQDGGLEQLGGVPDHPVEDELLRMTLPSCGQELQALPDHRVTGGSRWQVRGRKCRPVLVEEDEEGEGHYRNEEEKEGEIQVIILHSSRLS